jgi:signal transduction histidine kinase
MPEEQHILQIDSEKIYKIVSNLVSNSFKFTPDGGSITLDCAILPTDEGATMTLRVADTGMGISEKDLPHIFERFVSKSKNGTGLGLPICKELTEQMGGNFEINSELGRGTTVWISIPCKILNIERKEHL